MISKRYRRSINPQENLRQFSLNNSKGLDCTKPITDTDTVLDMKNLTLNLDGSLSIRKPMLSTFKIPRISETSGASNLKAHLTHTENHTAVVRDDGSLDVYDRHMSYNDNAISCTVEVYISDYYSNVKSATGWDLSSKYFNFTDASFCNTSDSTVVGNVLVNATKLADVGALDADLYKTYADENIDGLWLPRYIQMLYEEYVWKINIINPELNEFSIAEGSIPLNPNLCLDNPYAIRDSYGNTVPVVKNIIPYYSEDDSEYTSRKDISETRRNIQIWDNREDSQTTNYSNSRIADESEGIGYFYTVDDIAGAAVRFRAYTKDSKCYVSVETSKQLKGMKSPADIYFEFKNTNATGKARPESYLISYPTHKYCGKYLLNPTAHLQNLNSTAELKGFLYDADSLYGEYLGRNTRDPSEQVSLSIFSELPNTTGGEDLDGFCTVSLHTSEGDKSQTFGYVLDPNVVETTGSLELKYLDMTSSDIVVTGDVKDVDIYWAGNSAYEVTIWAGDTFGVSTSKFYLLSRDVDELHLVKDSTGKPLTVNYYELFENAEVQAWMYPVIDYIPSLSWTIPIVSLNASFKKLKVSKVTEQQTFENASDFRAVLKMANKFTLENTLLKAFCTLPKAHDVYYATWDYSVDGVAWNPHGNIPLDAYGKFERAYALNEKYTGTEENLKDNSDKDTTPADRYVLRNYVPLNVKYANDAICGDGSTTLRPDVLPISLLSKLFDEPETVSKFIFRFSIVTLYTKDDGELYVQTVISSNEMSLSYSDTAEYYETDFPNAALGNKSYYGGRLYSFGTPYDSFIYVSDVGSFITPLYNIIELKSTSKDFVHCVIPWRDYTMCLSEHSIHVSKKADDGFYTKTVTTSVGVPQNDSLCVCPTLNGILFKSGQSVYMAYPNVYYDDAVLNLTKISKPVEHILEELENKDIENPFSTVVDDLYVLMLPESSTALPTTHCLIYNLTSKTWEYYTYPIKATQFFKDAVYGTTLCSDVSEHFIFESDYSRYDSTLNRHLTYYADCLLYNKTFLDEGSYLESIPFSWDSGQKTDSIATPKQFVESKLMFATLGETDCFPFKIYVAVDGDSSVITTDVSTDAPFWKSGSAGVLNTAFRIGRPDTPASGVFNTLRQLVVRYSAKGKSVRHVIEGESFCNFKFYETYVRYKRISGK